MGEARGAYIVLVGKPEGKRSRRTWEESLKCIFNRWDEGMDWIDLAQDRERRKLL